MQFGPPSQASREHRIGRIRGAWLHLADAHAGGGSAGAGRRPPLAAVYKRESPLGLPLRSTVPLSRPPRVHSSLALPHALLRGPARAAAWCEVSGGKVEILWPPASTSPSSPLICVFSFPPSTHPADFYGWKEALSIDLPCSCVDLVCSCVDL